MEIQKKKHPGQSGADGNNELRTIEVKTRVSPTEKKDLEAEWRKSSEPKKAFFFRNKLLSTLIKVENKNQLDAEHAIRLMQLAKQTDVSQTGRMGSNLNQIAKRLNGKEPTTLRDVIDSLRAEIDEIRKTNTQVKVELRKLRGRL